MTPFSAFLYDICRSRRLLQKELAYALDVDPSYLSALATGRKGKPSEAFVRKLEEKLELNEEERYQLLKVVKASRLRFVVPEQAAPQEHLFVDTLFDLLGKLKPAQLNAMTEILKL